MKPITSSSSIAAVGHNPQTSVLSVKFHSGQTYHYAGVSTDQHSALVNAKSVGSHFMSHIRGKFEAPK